MKANYSTWCNHEIKAAIKLAEILNEQDNRFLIKKVNSYIHKFHIRKSALDELNECEKSYFLEMLLHDTLNNVRENFTGKVESYLCNVITAIYRNSLETNERI